jgi:hypothetical protein
MRKSPCERATSGYCTGQPKFLVVAPDDDGTGELLGPPCTKVLAPPASRQSLKRNHVSAQKKVGTAATEQRDAR